MNSIISASLLTDHRSKSRLFTLFFTASLVCGVFLIGSALLGTETFRLSPGFVPNGTQKYIDSEKCEAPSTENKTTENTSLEKCKAKCRPSGSETLPEGIVSSTSNLETRPLWGPGPVSYDTKSTPTRSLLAIAVGIKQKHFVNQIVKKFLKNSFVVILFHYDGIVDEWNEEWGGRVLHVSAMNQTKWWFAKRFLHPDIVAEYEYIFLWDEDLGVENFHPRRYISIIMDEGLEISQPALDPHKSEVHHHITTRRRGSKVHRELAVEDVLGWLMLHWILLTLCLKRLPTRIDLKWYLSVIEVSICGSSVLFSSGSAEGSRCLDVQLCYSPPEPRNWDKKVRFEECDIHGCVKSLSFRRITIIPFFISSITKENAFNRHRFKFPIVLGVNVHKSGAPKNFEGDVGTKMCFKIKIKKRLDGSCVPQHSRWHSVNEVCCSKNHISPELTWDIVGKE